MFWIVVDYFSYIPLTYVALRGLAYILSNVTGLKINNSLIFNSTVFILILLSAIFSYFIIINSRFLPLSLSFSLYISIIVVPLLYLGCYHPLYKALRNEYLYGPNNWKYILLWIDQNMTVISIYSTLFYISVKGIFGQ